MPLGRIFLPDPGDGEADAIVQRVPEGWSLELVVPDLRRPAPILVVCERCGAVINTGRLLARDLPLRATPPRPCACGGVARLPARYLMTDRYTRETIDVRDPRRDTATFPAITLAELLRLAQAARAVQDGQAGAEARLERVLAEAPGPIRRLRDRLGPGDWINVAVALLMLVQTVTPWLKAGEDVTEERLVSVIEKLVDQLEEGKAGPAADTLPPSDVPTGP